jgi:hypothetical protein
MTTPSPGTPAILNSPRALAALGLVGYVALAEFFAFIVWIGANGTFTTRSLGAAGELLDLALMAMPIVAVLIAAKIGAAIGMARTIVMVAVIEYAVMFVLGLITFLIGIGALFDIDSGILGTQALILGLAKLVLVAIVGYITFRIFTDMGGRFRAPGASYGPPQQPGSPSYPPAQQPGQYPGAQQ